MAARDLMTRTLVTLRPDDTIAEAIRVLVTHEISGAPVVDGGGRLVGLLSEHDCLRVIAYGDYTAEDLGMEDRVSSIMTTPAFVIDPHVGIYSIAHLFLKHRIRRIPVVEDGRLVGLVARRDALRGIQTLIERRKTPTLPPGRTPKLYLSATGTPPDVIANKLE